MTLLGLTWLGVSKSGKGNIVGFIMTFTNIVGGQILVLSGELQEPEGDVVCQFEATGGRRAHWWGGSWGAAKIAAAVEEHNENEHMFRSYVENVVLIIG